MIVVLKAPSLADRVAAAGGRATETQERSWTAAAYAAQTRLLKSLALDGITVKPDYSYARVLNGFAATLDPRALVLLEHNAQVDAVYPVRAAFPAALSRRVGRAKTLAAAGARGPGSESARSRRARRDDRPARHRHRPDPSRSCTAASCRAST